MSTKARTSAVTGRLALASVLVLAPVSGAIAQTPQGQSQGQGQAQGQNAGQPAARPAVPARGVVQGQEASAQPAGVDIPFTFAAGEAGEQAVNGVFTVQRFVHEGTQVIAAGKITATTLTAEGTVQNFVTQARLPVLPTTRPGAVCSTLHMELGPLDIELGNQRVQLDQIALDIAAQAVDVTAPAERDSELATSLCAVGGLLDSGALGNQGAQLAARLNELLRLLG